jgi:uncharacterized protein
MITKLIALSIYLKKCITKASSSILIFAILMISTAFTTTPITSTMLAHTIRLTPHTDVRKALEEYVLANNIQAACIVTAVGSVEQASIRYANQKSTDTITGFAEIISLVGTLSSTGGSHLHIGISNNKGATIGGHLQYGTLVYTTAEIVIAALPNTMFTREVDSTYGYKELVPIQK